MSLIKVVQLLSRADKDAPALPQHHGPTDRPRVPQYDAVNVLEHALQPVAQGHVVQSAVTRMHPERG